MSSKQTFCTMSGFTEKEVLAIEKFRARLADILPVAVGTFGQRDDSLIRWIRAREMDLDKAENMFRNSIEWRANNKIDSILKSGVDSELEQQFPYYLDGVDKNGRPVVTIPMGKWDIRSCIETEDGIIRFTRYTNQMLERIVGEIKQRTLENAENGRDHDESACVQFVTISNMSGYSYRQLANLKAVQALIQMVSVYEAHYPETLARAIIINAPTIFSILFGMMKPFMSGRTLNKIQVFSDNQEQWQPAVSELIDPDQIREQFGGTKAVSIL